MQSSKIFVMAGLCLTIMFLIGGAVPIAAGDVNDTDINQFWGITSQTPFLPNLTRLVPDSFPNITTVRSNHSHKLPDYARYSPNRDLNSPFFLPNMTEHLSDSFPKMSAMRVNHNPNATKPFRDDLRVSQLSESNVSMSVLPYSTASQWGLNYTTVVNNSYSRNTTIVKQGGITILQPLYPGGAGYSCDCIEDPNKQGYCLDNNPVSYTIYSPGMYILGSGFEGRGISIISPNVILDGNNQIIDGKWADQVISINSMASNTTIQNFGGLFCFYRGIVSDASNVTIVGNTVSYPYNLYGSIASYGPYAHILKNTVGSIISRGSYTTIVDNTVCSWSQFGSVGNSENIFGSIFSSGPHSTISGNKVSINIGGTKWLGMDIRGENTTVSGNIVHDTGGIWLSNGGAIINNIFYNNSGHIYGNGSASISGNTVYNSTGSSYYSQSRDTGCIFGDGSAIVFDNTVYNNSGDGIDASGNTTVSGNIVYNNTGDGIDASGNTTVSGNIVYNNTGDGIDASGNTTVSGNTAYNNTVGIDASGNTTVSGNTAYNNIYAIYGGDNAIISGNTIHNSAEGIFGHDNTTVSDNTIHNNVEGIYSGDSAIVSGNIVWDNIYYGIRADFSNNVTIYDNTVHNNVEGIYAGNSVNATVTGNTAYNNSYDGVHANNSINAIISDNTVYNNSYNGINVSNSINDTISGNTVYNNNKKGENYVGGIKYNGNKYVTISGNTVYNNRYGLVDSNYGSYGRNATISGNNIYNNNVCGINDFEDDYPTISGNKVFNNGVGMALGSPNGFNGNIFGNNISDNKLGLKVFTNGNGYIYNNYFGNDQNVSTNNLTGVKWTNSAGPTPGENIMDDPYIAGNYWSNPNGTGWSDKQPGNRSGYTNVPYLVASNTGKSLPYNNGIGINNSTPYQVAQGTYDIYPLVPDTTIPVVLIHGWTGDESSFTDIEKIFDSNGIKYWPFNYVVDKDPRELATDLNTFINDKRKETKYEGPIDIYTHSMGGLIARWYMEQVSRDSSFNVRQWIGVATPNHGSAFADLSHCEVYPITNFNPIDCTFWEIYQGYRAFLVKPYSWIMQKFGSQIKLPSWFDIQVSQLETDSDMVTQLDANIKNNTLPTDIKYRVITGYNPTKSKTLGFLGMTRGRSLPYSGSSSHYYWTYYGDEIVAVPQAIIQGKDFDILPRYPNAISGSPDSYCHTEIWHNQELLDLILSYYNNPTQKSSNKEPSFNGDYDFLLSDAFIQIVKPISSGVSKVVNFEIPNNLELQFGDLIVLDGFSGYNERFQKASGEEDILSNHVKITLTSPSGIKTSITPESSSFFASSSNKTYIIINNLTEQGNYFINITPNGSSTFDFSGNVSLTGLQTSPYSIIVNNITPSIGPNTGTITTTITGHNFITGLSANLTNSTINIPGTVTFKNSTILLCSFPLAGAPPWTYNLKLTNPQGQSSLLWNAFTVTNLTPSITSITPSSAYNSTPMPVTIKGTGFRKGATVTLVNGSTTLPGILTNQTTTQILCTLPLTNVKAGLYNLTIQNIDGSSTTKTNAFTVLTAGTNPTITDITPASGLNKAPLPVTINGTNFRTGATVTITNGSTTKTVAATSVTPNCTKCSLPLTGLPFGLYNLTITNKDGSSVTLPTAFRISYQIPTISTVSPSTGFSSGPIAIAISGTNFMSGLQTTLVNNSTIIPGTVSSFTTTKFTGTFNLTSVSNGLYNLTVTSPDGSSATKLNCFTVKKPSTDPSITTINPSSGINTAVLPVVINGSNFRTGVAVTITNGSMNKTVTGTVTGNSTIKCSMPLTGLPIGLYNLTVKNTDGTTGTLPDAFQVTNPAPIVTTISPVSGFDTGSMQITIAGSKFVNGVQVSLINGSLSLPGVISGFTTAKFTGTFNLTASPAVIYSLVVTNPGGPNTTKPNCFTVKASGINPSISNISPTTGINTAALPVLINGTNFRTGVKVTITNGTTTKTVSATSSSNIQIKCSLPLTGLPIGLYNLTLSNTDGSTVTQQNAFTVNNPTPTITAINPISGYNLRSVQVAISGTNFVNGVQTLLDNGSTSLPGLVSSKTATKFTSTFVLTGSPAGLYNLTVTNPGGPSAKKQNCFTVLLSGTTPTIANFFPTSGINAAALSFTVNGTNYRPGASVTLTKGLTNKTVAATSVTNAQIKCSLPLTGLSIGQYNLTVQNADGSSVTQTDAFLVTNPGPTISTIIPVSGYNTGTLPVAIVGTKFISGATIVLVNGSTTVTGTVVSLTGTSIAGSFPLTNAPAGKYNLTVSNPGNIYGTKLNAFTIMVPGTAPVVSTINPASGFNNANLPVTISGLNFRTPKVYLNQGSLLKLATATSGKTSTATNLYVMLPLTGIPGGLYNITVRNSDGVNATAQNIFYVTDQAWISSTPGTVGRTLGVPKEGNPPSALLTFGPSDRQILRIVGVNSGGRR